MVDFVAGTIGIMVELKRARRRGVKFNSPMKAHSTVTAPVVNYRIESLLYTIISNGSKSRQLNILFVRFFILKTAPMGFEWVPKAA